MQYFWSKGIYAFEIKRSRKVHSQDLKSLQLLQLDYPGAKPYLLYGGEQTECHGSITVMPYKQAIKSLLNLIGG
jgi:uncharacterized protein